MDESTDRTREAHRTEPDRPLPSDWVGVDDQGRVGRVMLEMAGVMLLRVMRGGAEWMAMADSVRRATDAEAAEAERAVCHYCAERTDDPTQVGLTESMSGPGWPIEACPACVTFRRLLPFAEHPEESHGSVRHVDGSLLREAL